MKTLQILLDTVKIMHQLCRRLWFKWDGVGVGVVLGMDVANDAVIKKVVCASSSNQINTIYSVI